MIRIVFLSVVLILLSGSAACAATWGESLFKEKSHDFGRVALGSDTIYRFEMMNMFKEDIRILGVHSSCVPVAAAPYRA